MRLNDRVIKATKATKTANKSKPKLRLITKYIILELREGQLIVPFVDHGYCKSEIFEHLGYDNEDEAKYAILKHALYDYTTNYVIQPVYRAEEIEE